jgi:hypothetical protein
MIPYPTITLQTDTHASSQCLFVNSVCHLSQIKPRMASYIYLIDPSSYKMPHEVVADVEAFGIFWKRLSHLERNLTTNAVLS